MWREIAPILFTAGYFASVLLTVVLIVLFFRLKQSTEIDFRKPVEEILVDIAEAPEREGRVKKAMLITLAILALVLTLTTVAGIYVIAQGG